MGFDPTLIERAARRQADRAIEAAMRDGKFDGLPGAGQPITGLDRAWSLDDWVRDWSQRERLKRSRTTNEDR